MLAVLHFERALCTSYNCFEILKQKRRLLSALLSAPQSAPQSVENTVILC